MYAIIKFRGKQYRVKKDDIIDVDLINLDNLEQGSSVTFGEVLFATDAEGNPQFGAPLVSHFSVKGELVGEVQGEKVIGMKYKRRKQERKTFGHRQRYSRVKITEISSGEKKTKR
jgi:large subunit ribosomal protein L27